MIYPNGSEPIFTDFPFVELRAVKHCVCSDGRSRLVQKIGQPMTMWTAPGSVKVKGKSVSGWIVLNDNGYHFHANKKGVNGHLLPEN